MLMDFAAMPVHIGRTARPRPSGTLVKKFFGSFFQKRTESFFLKRVRRLSSIRGLVRPSRVAQATRTHAHLTKMRCAAIKQLAPLDVMCRMISGNLL
jgi:hypothetical protein